MIIELNKNNFDETIKSESPVLVKYFQPHCAPCRLIAPIIDKLSENTQGIAFFQIDVDKNPVLAQNAKLMSVPVLILYKDSKEIARLNGLFQELEIIKFIETNVNKKINSI